MPLGLKRAPRPRYAGTMATEFRLRFPLSTVPNWAARYAYADDAGAETIGEDARRRGWCTWDEFLAVARWKTPREQEPLREERRILRRGDH